MVRTKPTPLLTADTCAFCGADTQLYVHAIPTCTRCDTELFLERRWRIPVNREEEKNATPESKYGAPRKPPLGQAGSKEGEGKKVS